MKDWQLFENECILFLNKEFGTDSIKFISIGNHDSTTSDIQVVKNNNSLFLIESKMSKAQSGQFVLLIENNQFIYSSENKTFENDYTQLIADYINKNFDQYKDVGTKALEIQLPKSHFEHWIINHYSSKGVKFVITSLNNMFVILPIEKYGDYFNVTANFRRKKSGSSELPQKYFEPVEQHFKTSSSKPVSFNKKGKKTYLNSEEYFDKLKFSISDINCQLSFKEDQGMYEIRKLGSTNNPNVIFSVECIKEQDKSDLELFIKILNNS